MPHLNYVHSGKGRAIVILHGLFGSSANWRGIAKALSNDYQVIIPDLRNHGNSFHQDRMGYHDMAQDVAELINVLNLSDIIVVGHSMGGKVAMTLALMNNPIISGYVFADIAPVNYQHDFSLLIEAMKALPLTSIKNRQQAEQLLLEKIHKPGLVKFIAQNIIRTNQGFRWRINLDAIEANISAILQFPDDLKGKQCQQPSLFIGGANSPYMKDIYNKAIFDYFPATEIIMLEDAGHWLHSDKPKEFIGSITDFIQYI